jgi:adenylate cyclase
MKQFVVDFLRDKQISVGEDQTILAASLAAGIPHYHSCGGKAQCSTCRIRILEGMENLSLYTDKEIALRQKIPFPKNVRLACQCYVTGNGVRVHRIIRDEIDISMYIKEDTLTDLEYTGEEKELALFFLDIRDFTSFINAYLPFDVIHIIRRLFNLFRKVIDQNNGSIIETEGDGFYATFGFETTPHQAVENATLAGFQILSEIKIFNETYVYKHFRHKFQVGIGVHTGNVIIGNIGIGVNNNLTVMGAPVNIAARLQAATKDYNNSFIISGKAFNLLSAKPSDIAASAKLRGIKDPIDIHLIGEPYDKI